MIPLPAQIIGMVEEYPTQAYYDTYLSYNHQLDHIVRVGEMYLRKNGFDALANTTTVIHTDKNYCTPLPHKTVATLAGLGWIGEKLPFSDTRVWQCSENFKFIDQCAIPLRRAIFREPVWCLFHLCPDLSGKSFKRHFMEAGY